MFQSTLFGYTLKEAPREAESPSHRYLTRGAYINQLGSGIYSLLPLGYRVYKKIEGIIREEINAVGGQELLMPSLQPGTLWKETGRWETIDPPLFKLQDRHEKTLALGSTHEEVVTDLARTYIRSYRDLPCAVYQIQTKFRNEMRATGGLLRVREFIMKDLYSFHATPEDLDQYYELVKQAYLRIYKRCGVNALPIGASSGSIGGNSSNEFACIAHSGEDKIAVCSNCNFAANVEIMEKHDTCLQCGHAINLQHAIEVGHIFKLGTKYSEKMNATFIDEQGKKQELIMGCYGIGIGRLLATAVEVHHDDKGIIWPLSIAPFHVHLIPLTNKKNTEGTIEKTSLSLYEHLQKRGIDVLYDDRPGLTAGEKFNDSDLLGIPIRLVVSEKTLACDSVELKLRSSGESEIMSYNDSIDRINHYVATL